MAIRHGVETGLATPFVIDIRSTDGPLPAEVTVEMPRGYLAMFDENGLDPPPDSVTSDGDTEIWTFAPGDVSVLSIDFDARLQPNMHYDRDGGWSSAVAATRCASTSPPG